jgi:hypothetical protein
MIQSHGVMDLFCRIGAVAQGNAFSRTKWTHRHRSHAVAKNDSLAFIHSINVPLLLRQIQQNTYRVI